eukprot:gene10806-19611_t
MLLVFITVSFWMAVGMCVIITDEIRLHKDLHKDGISLLLPEEEGAIRRANVTIGLTLNQLVDVEETNEHVILNAFIRQLWYNPNLRWDPNKYGGISQVNVQPHQIWTPDLYLYANVEEDKNYNGFLDTLKTRVTLRSDGLAKWLSPIMFRISCGINVAKFPFDTQKCEFRFGSFTYDSDKLTLKPELSTADLSNYTENVEWHVISMDTKKTQTLHTCCKNKFDEVTFNLVIKRKPLFLLVNLIAPNMIFSFLTIVVYLIPAGSSERSSFVVSLVLAMALFLTSSIDLMPDSSEVIPLFSYFLGLVLLAMFLLTITVCYSLSIYYANASVAVMPFWMRKYLLHKLAPFFGITIRAKRSGNKSNKGNGEEFYLTTAINDELECCHPGRLWKAENSLRQPGCLWNNKERNHKILKELNLDSRADKKALKKINKHLTKIIDNMELEEERAHRQGEWQAVSKVLDNVCFWFFICAFLLVITFCSIKGATLD